MTKYPEVVYRRGQKTRPVVKAQYKKATSTCYHFGNKSKGVVVDPKTGLVKRVPVGQE